MNAAGGLMVVVGVWALCQIFGGNAITRLGIA